MGSSSLVVASYEEQKITSMSAQRPGGTSHNTNAMIRVSKSVCSVEVVTGQGGQVGRVDGAIKSRPSWTRAPSMPGLCYKTVVSERPLYFQVLKDRKTGQ